MRARAAWGVGVVVALLGVALLLRDDEVVQPVAAPPLTAPVEAVRPAIRAPVFAAPPSPPAGLERPPPPTAAPVVTVSIDAGEAATPLEAPTVDAGDVAVEPAPEPDATPPDDRFGARWGKPGLCGDEPFAALATRRAERLATFTTVQRAGATVHRDRGVPVDVANLVGRALEHARLVAVGLLGPRADVTPPDVYIYANADQMHDVACAKSSAIVGYYDGAIHLPGDDADVVRTVVHEFVHHALNSMGVRKPMWLHEGIAMYAADERWWEDPRLGLVPWLASKHLPFPSMVEAFPHTADALFAGAAYYQSYEMVRFVGAHARRPDFSWLVDGLLAGTLTERRCFEEAIGLEGAALEAAWQQHLAAR